MEISEDGHRRYGAQFELTTVVKLFFLVACSVLQLQSFFMRVLDIVPPYSVTALAPAPPQKLLKRQRQEESKGQHDTERLSRAPHPRKHVHSRPISTEVVVSRFTDKPFR